MKMARRLFLASAPALLVTRSATAEPARFDYPTQEPELVQEMVVVSHGNLPRVKALLALHPTLAKAAWDWGFGDWEDALGAASHVGNRAIAELLLASGARPTLFSAAMLGQLDVVQAFVAASPGIQRIKGPHTITLLRHALAGGDASRAVVQYLQAIGADERPVEQPLSDDDLRLLAGAYSYGATASHRLDVAVERGQLTVARPGRFARNLFHLGGLVFQPVGAEEVRLRFARTATEVVLTVHDPDVVVTARKPLS